MSNSIFKFVIVVSFLFAAANIWMPLTLNGAMDAFDNANHMDLGDGGPWPTNTSNTTALEVQNSSRMDLESAQSEEPSLQVGDIDILIATGSNDPSNSTFDVQQDSQETLASFNSIIKPFDAKGAVAIARRKKQLASEALLDHHFYTKQELQALIDSLTSTFHVWGSSTPHSWCHRRRGGGRNDGLLYVKLPKCASSTASGVAMRVADKLGRRLLGGKCAGRYFHSPASHKLRDHYFFEQVSRQKMDASAEAILSFLSYKDAMKKNYMIRYLKLEAISTNMRELIHDIMARYNFIGVADRMDESLVVLAMIMQVPVADVVLLSSKISGGYDAGGGKEGCVKLAKKIHFPAVDEYLQSKDWKKDNWDYILFQVVNQTLDNTIDHFGRANVQREVETLRQLSAKAHDECMNETVFPCPETLPNHQELSKKSCYLKDSGCGYACIDRVLGEISDKQWEAIKKSLNPNVRAISSPKSGVLEALTNKSDIAASRVSNRNANELHVQNASAASTQNTTGIPDYLLRYVQFHRESVEGGKVKDGVPFLVYRCYGGCAGLGGRIKAMIKSFYAAVCSQRVFLIDSPFPLPLQDYLAPNMIEWNASYRNETDELDIFVRQGKGENYLVIPDNMTGIIIAKAHDAALMSIHIITGGSRVLFQFTDQVEARAAKLLQNAGVVSSQPYVAAHLRTGSGPTWDDKALRLMRQNRTGPAPFAECFQLLRDTHGYTQGYIAADNDAPKSALNQIEPLLKFATVEIFHIDRSLSTNATDTMSFFHDPNGRSLSGTGSMEHARNGTLDLFAELKVLVDSNCRIMSWSSLSYVSHFMALQPHCGLLSTDCSNATILQPYRKYNLMISKWRTFSVQ
ncbi:sulfotransferase family [Fragilaria crotonensis]|nr:sulfotransferase family [Fragilaria crotonensis]